MVNNYINYDKRKLQGPCWLYLLTKILENDILWLWLWFCFLWYRVFVHFFQIYLRDALTWYFAFYCTKHLVHALNPWITSVNFWKTGLSQSVFSSHSLSVRWWSICSGKIMTQESHVWYKMLMKVQVFLLNLPRFCWGFEVIR